MTEQVDTVKLREFALGEYISLEMKCAINAVADELDALRKERDELGKVLKIKAIALDYVVSSVSWLSSCPSPMSHFSFEEMLDKIHEFVTSPLIASEVETHIGYSETNLLISIDDYAEERKKSDDEITALRARVAELESQLADAQDGLTDIKTHMERAMKGEHRMSTVWQIADMRLAAIEAAKGDAK